jgi:hypothetical protein
MIVTAQVNLRIAALKHSGSTDSHSWDNRFSNPPSQEHDRVPEELSLLDVIAPSGPVPFGFECTFATVGDSMVYFPNH